MTIPSLGSPNEPLTATVPPPPATEHTPSVVKRGRGRPPKSGGAKVIVSGGEIQTADAGAVMSNGGGVKRGRGRPRRFGNGPVTVPLSGNLLRPRGRPKRVGRANVGGSGGGGEGGLGLRRRGRPSRNNSSAKASETGGHNVGGRGPEVVVTDPKQLVAYQELKGKYELLQSKVKQVASMVKSFIAPDYVNTLGALQELEHLAGEADAPSHGQLALPLQN